ncbi:MAG: metallophosphoesterase [bacterium]
MADVFSVIHISDPHFHRLPKKASQWFSKRAFGALNMVVRRARFYPIARARRLVEMVDGLDWQHLVITGDLTQLALEEEFELARATLAPLLERGPEHVTVLPGNHDRYVAPSEREMGFDAFFGPFFGGGEIRTVQLTEAWGLAGWDSARPTRSLSAAGRVKNETLAATAAWLDQLTPRTRVIVANHYPLYFDAPDRYRAGHELEQIEQVRHWLAEKKIDLYLHGHLHRNWVLQTRHGGHGCTHVNSASSTQTPQRGGSAFHRIELDGADFRVLPLALD